ncbi:hypothetical protein GCM10007111_37210 [Virgibacillus kapii]|nr:hypothetical protein GCM10007111_37210 [Virgibacillus kapii]
MEEVVIECHNVKRGQATKITEFGLKKQQKCRGNWFVNSLKRIFTIFSRNFPFENKTKEEIPYCTIKLDLR